MLDAIRARDIVVGLGGKPFGKLQGRAPCPVCGRNTFTVQDKNDKVLFTCWGECPRDAIIDALRQKNLWRGRPDDHGRLSAEDRAELERRRQERAQREREEQEVRSEGAARIFHNALPIAGTAAETYLRQRGIRIKLPPSLRFSPGMRHGPTGLVFPTLIGALQALDRHIVSIQRIFIDPQTHRKALVESAKMTLGPMGDGAVRLARNGRTLGLAEGIETALSAMQIYSLPVWAVLGANRMGSIGLPDDVQEVVIFADRGQVGEASAEDAAEAYDRQGRRAHVLLPEAGFKDFNDQIQGVRMPEAAAA